MPNISFVAQPDSKSCALASYTMVAKYFFPEISLEDVSRISDWRSGYVVWPFKFWLWIMDKGIRITDYDTVDYQAWSDQGVEGLKKSITAKELDFYIKNSRDLTVLAEDIKKVLNHDNFKYVQAKPNWEDLKAAVAANKICEVVLDSRTLRPQPGFDLHRVVISEINDATITMNDPGSGGASYVADIAVFKKAWLGAVAGSELCIYES